LRTTHDVFPSYAKLRSSLRRIVASQFTLGTTPPKTKSKYWFPAKRYGWGWGAPVCWEGKAVTAIYLITLFSGAAFVETSPHLMILLIGVAVVGLLGVCLWKGEKPRWRWGKD